MAITTPFLRRRATAEPYGQWQGNSLGHGLPASVPLFDKERDF